METLNPEKAPVLHPVSKHRSSGLLPAFGLLLLSRIKTDHVFTLATLRPTLNFLAWHRRPSVIWPLTPFQFSVLSHTSYASGLFHYE